MPLTALQNHHILSATHLLTRLSRLWQTFCLCANPALQNHPLPLNNLPLNSINTLPKVETNVTFHHLDPSTFSLSTVCPVNTHTPIQKGKHALKSHPNIAKSRWPLIVCLELLGLNSDCCLSTPKSRIKL